MGTTSSLSLSSGATTPYNPLLISSRNIVARRYVINERIRVPEILNSGLVEINSNAADKVFEPFHSYPLNSIPLEGGAHPPFFVSTRIKIPPKANEKSPCYSLRIYMRRRGSWFFFSAFFSPPFLREQEEKQADWSGYRCWNFENRIGI